MGAVTDITAAKEAEEKIRQSEKEARQLLDLSPLHITELGPDGARLYTNRAALDYYGITLEEWQDADLQQAAASAGRRDRGEGPSRKTPERIAV